MWRLPNVRLLVLGLGNALILIAISLPVNLPAQENDIKFEHHRWRSDIPVVDPR